MGNYGNLVAMIEQADRARSGAAIQAGGRSDHYYASQRPDVAALVPRECHRVLDIGCGTGQLGRLLKERGHHVTAVELVPESAAEASIWLDRVVNADVEKGLPFAPASFEAVIFADLLEHLVDPWRVLCEAAKLLTPGGIVIASVPNVQNHKVLYRLIRGRWRYRERGILDRGHLRFFTRQTIQDLFAHAGLKIKHIGHNYRRSALRETLCFLTAGRARAFLTRQYLIVAQVDSPRIDERERQ